MCFLRPTRSPLDETDLDQSVAMSELDPTKFQLHKGRIKSIELVLGEMHPFDYYLVSKKYNWLLCETDHSVLIALGAML